LVKAPSRRGAALFVVLLFSAFLAGLAASAMRTSLSGVRAAAVFADVMRADELGRGAGDILAYHLTTAGVSAKRGGRIEMRFAGADIVIDYLSESARVDVNLAPVELLAALLAAAGGDPAVVDATADRITRFRAAKAREAAALTPAVNPSGLAAITAQLNAIRPSGTASVPPLAIGDIGEVAGAWGLPDGLARRVLPSLTLSNGTAKVDPVLADRLVVAALVGADERVDDYLARRQQGFVNKDSALDLLPIPARTFVDFADSAAVRAIVRVIVAHRLERRYEMVLAPPAVQGAVAARDAVPVVVSWRKLP
jgi:general secretion pathway protein K